MKKVKPEYILGVLAVVILIFAFYKYSNERNMSYMGMSNNNLTPSTINPSPLNNQQLQNVVPDNSVTTKSVNQPNDLLPSDSASNVFAQTNPLGSSNLANVNLLNPQQVVGINTQGSSLRNSNLQIRSEPPNPRTNTNCPWNISTIEADQMRRPLEIGSGA
tara:strand:- start:7190 stop:7672 length:483 start_codon:yes stop_codon:yes gene_type:complete